MAVWTAAATSSLVASGAGSSVVVVAVDAVEAMNDATSIEVADPSDRVDVGVEDRETELVRRWR